MPSLTFPAMSSEEFAAALARYGYAARLHQRSITLERRRDGRVVILDREPVIAPEKIVLLLAATNVTSDELLASLDREEILGARPQVLGSPPTKRRGERQD